MSVKKTPPRLGTGSLPKAGKNKKVPKKKVSKKKSIAKKIVKKKAIKKKVSAKGPNKKELKKAVAKLPGLIVEQAKLVPPVDVIPAEGGKEKNLSAKTFIKKPTEVIEIRELKPSGETKTRVGQNYDDGRDKKWLVWLGVIIFTIAILTLWGWSLIVKFQDVTKVEDLGIINNVKEDITTIFDDTEDADVAKSPETEEDENPPEDLKEKIKQNLANIISAINTSTSTTEIETEGPDEVLENNNNEIITPSL